MQTGKYTGVGVQRDFATLGGTDPDCKIRPNTYAFTHHVEEITNAVGEVQEELVSKAFSLGLAGKCDDKGQDRKAFFYGAS